MRLHEVPKGSKIKVKSEVVVPPGGIAPTNDEELIFNNVDGMYSHCLTLDGRIVHLSMFTEVEIVND